MSLKNIAAPESSLGLDGRGQISVQKDSGHLQGRYVMNLGTNVIHVLPNYDDKDFLNGQGKTLVAPKKIASGQVEWLDNFCVIISTDDGRPASTVQAFNEDGLNKIKAAIAGRKLRLK